MSLVVGCFKMRFIFFSLFFLLLSSLLVSAIGVIPARYTVDYAPGFEHDFTFTVNNNQQKPIKVAISLSGSFADYATLSTKELSFPDGVLTQSFTLHLKLPDSWDKPGRNKLNINIVEMPFTNAKSAAFSARTAVVPDILVLVPYPGLYAEISKFQVAGGSGGVNEGDDTPVSFSIRSHGKQDLVNTRAEVSLVDFEANNTIETQSFNNIDISPGSTYSQSLILHTSSLPPTDYLAVLKYYYEDVVREKKIKFSVGQFKVDLLSYDENLSNNGIVPFHFVIKNKWKGKVFVEAQVHFNGLPVAKTSREQLTDFAAKKFVAYVDASSLPLGPLNGTIKVFFSKKSSPDDDSVLEFPVSVNVVKPVVKEVVKKNKSFSLSLTTIVLIVLFLLLVINGFFLVKVFRSKRKNRRR